MINWGKKKWFQTQFDNTQSGNSDYFSHHLSGYQKNRLDWIVSIIGVHYNNCNKKPNYLLDVGSATGVLGERISSLIGVNMHIRVDFIFDVLKHGNIISQGRSQSVCADIRNLPFSEAVFDIVLLSEVLYYLSNEELKLALSDINIILNESGDLIICTAFDGGKKYGSLEVMLESLENYFVVKEVFFVPVRIGRLIEKVINRLRALGKKLEDRTLNKQLSFYHSLNLFFGKMFVALSSSIFSSYKLYNIAYKIESIIMKSRPSTGSAIIFLKKEN